MIHTEAWFRSSKKAVGPRVFQQALQSHLSEWYGAMDVHVKVSVRKSDFKEGIYGVEVILEGDYPSTIPKVVHECKAVARESGWHFLILERAQGEHLTLYGHAVPEKDSPVRGPLLHFTRAENLPSIQRQGLLPRVPVSGLDSPRGVYLVQPGEFAQKVLFDLHRQSLQHDPAYSEEGEWALLRIDALPRPRAYRDYDWAPMDLEPEQDGEAFYYKFKIPPGLIHVVGVGTVDQLAGKAT